MEALEAISGRRSIRRFKATPVEAEKLGIILEAARQAPSWANSQCWRFVVVRDPRIKDRLADTAIPVTKGGTNRATEAMRTAPLAIVAYAGEIGVYPW